MVIVALPYRPRFVLLQHNILSLICVCKVLVNLSTRMEIYVWNHFIPV